MSFNKSTFLASLLIVAFTSTTLAKSTSQLKAVGRTPQTYLTQEEEMAESIAHDSNCKIVINTEHFTGVKETQNIHTKAKSKEDCERRAKPHKFNFYPKEIKTKSVVFFYEAGK